MTNNILVVGATGQQGRAVIDALYANHEPAGQIIALTRSACSAKSQALKTKYPDIILAEGDTRQPETIFTAHPNISSIFLVTVPPNEEEQALPFLQAAAAASSSQGNNKVQHIVFSSVDRGGDVASWTHPTQVPHFAAKHGIELRLRQLCEEAGIQWTILRPTGFMDTYNPGFFGKLMAALWAAGMPADRRLQLISTHDIGVFAAKALTDPAKWASKSLSLAGDDLSIDELRQIFKRVVGQDLPQTYSVLAHPVLWWVADARTSFEWFRDVGYGADIESLREQEPRLQTFEAWLRESSRWDVQ